MEYPWSCWSPFQSIVSTLRQMHVGVDCFLQGSLSPRLNQHKSRSIGSRERRTEGFMSFSQGFNFE